MKPLAVFWLSLFPLLFGYVLWSCFQAEQERKRLIKTTREVSPEILVAIFGSENVWPFDRKAKFKPAQFQMLLNSPRLGQHAELKALRNRFQVSEKRSAVFIITLLVLWLAVWLRLWLAP